MQIRSHLARLQKYVPFRYLPGIAAALAVVIAVAFGALEGVEYWSLEKFFEFRGVRHPAIPLVMVTIDEPSFFELNKQWPFPRAWHGEVIRRIAADKPLAIGVDVLFPEPSSLGEADDEALGAAVAAAGNVVLGSAPKVEFRPGIGVQVDQNIPVKDIRGDAVVAPVQMEHDDVDSHVRRAPLFLVVPDEKDKSGFSSVDAFERARGDDHHHRQGPGHAWKVAERHVFPERGEPPTTQHSL